MSKQNLDKGRRRWFSRRKKQQEDAERIRNLARELETEGWKWSPLVVHADELWGGLDRYEAAVAMGMEDQVPHVPLEDIFAEAGMDMPQIAGEENPDEEFFEDYLRGLPEHIRDKYEL